MLLFLDQLIAGRLPLSLLKLEHVVQFLLLLQETNYSPIVDVHDVIAELG